MRAFQSPSALSPRPRGAEMIERRRGNEERGLDRPTEYFLRLLHVGDAERRAVRLEGVLLRRAEAEMGADEDQRRPRVSAEAAASAASIACRSLPSSTWIVCQHFGLDDRHQPASWQGDA
jgi:hypothetical protein